MAAKLARSQRTHAPDLADGRAVLKVGDLLAGKYRVERILGEGGMGVVVAAHHELLDQHVAVKLLYHDVADGEAETRLLQEARAAAKLQSDHVARVVDVDTGADGLPFIVMELLDGADLCQIADARGALPRWLVVDYVLQALEGLAHAHVRGIIHRDLKPSNLFLANRPDGTQIIKILDFGIAKAPASEGDRRQKQLTGGRAVLGSPPYMSPEQVRAPKKVDHRTDIWSLGVCMYELLTNSMPFGGDEVQETFAQILEREPTPIRQLVTGVPEGLEQIVAKCLAKSRDHRFADVGELARALVPFGSGTWIQSADRVVATLARGVDDASHTRMKGPPSSHERVLIPSAPGRRPDASPELTGTASTVTGSAFEAKRRWIFAAAAVFTTIGLALIGLTVLTHRGDAEIVPSEPAPAASASGVAPSGEIAAPTAGPATTLVTAPVTTASPENDIGGGGAASAVVVGASPVPPSTPAKKAVPVSAPPPRAASPAKKAAPPATSKPALPPGLPRERR